MNRFILGLMLALMAGYVVAQTPVTPRKGPNTIAGYLVVATCGTLPAPAYVAGNYAAPTIDVTGKLCVSQ
jgi:hypothetical protein